MKPLFLVLLVSTLLTSLAWSADYVIHGQPTNALLKTTCPANKLTAASIFLMDSATRLDSTNDTDGNASFNISIPKSDRDGVKVAPVKVVCQVQFDAILEGPSIQSQGTETQYSAYYVSADLAESNVRYERIISIQFDAR